MAKWASHFARSTLRVAVMKMGKKRKNARDERTRRGKSKEEAASRDAESFADDFH